MLKIYLTRHGQDEDNVRGILNGHRDMPLTKLGVKQAENLARAIAKSNIKFDLILSSPLKRANKTAQIIASELDMPEPIVMPELIERNFGVMTGKNQNQIEELCAPEILKAGNVTYFLNPDGAETFPQLVDRGHKIIKKVEETYSDGNILLVSHGDIGKMIYCAFYDLDWREALQAFNFGNSDLVLLSKNTDPSAAKVFSFKQYNV